MSSAEDRPKQRLQDRLAASLPTPQALADGLKVLCVTAGSLAAVVCASMIISIIQFQSRLSEARTQNSNITFESIKLLTEHRDQIAERYKKMQRHIVALGPLQAELLGYFESMDQHISSLCNTVAPDKDKYDECYKSVAGHVAIYNDKLDEVIAQFRSGQPSSQTDVFVQRLLERLVTMAVSGRAQQEKFAALRYEMQSLCEWLKQSVLTRQGTIILVAAELRDRIESECYLGSSIAMPQQALAVQAAQPASSLSSSPQVLTIGTQIGSAAPVRSETQGVNNVLLSELVFYFKFYENLASKLGEFGASLILAPPEFITIILVVTTGVLGSFLFHTYAMFSVAPGGVFPSFGAIFLRATLGVMCALVIFILMRTGFVAVTEAQAREAGASISPFVIAFTSVSAGLLADRALERIKDASNRVFERGRGDGNDPPDDAAKPPAVNTVRPSDPDTGRQQGSGQ